MRIIWAKETQDDFRRFNEFLKPINPNAALAATKAINDQVKMLVEYPNAGTALDDDTGRRELYIQFGTHGYVLRYVPDIKAKVIRILRIWHGREDR
jgi:plasmid stabilization system protein ParE